VVYSIEVRALCLKLEAALLRPLQQGETTHGKERKKKKKLKKVIQKRKKN